MNSVTPKFFAARKKKTKEDKSINEKVIIIIIVVKNVFCGVLMLHQHYKTKTQKTTNRK